MCTDLCYASSDSVLIALAINDGGHFLGYAYLACTTQISNGGAIQLAANLFADNSCAGQGCDILQHCFATVTKARSLNSNSLEGTTQLVYNQSSQCFAFDILGDNQQLATALYNLFQNRHNVLDHVDFSIGDENERIA